jgi:quercetin dioxygenase-like cupin family protein
MRRVVTGFDADGRSTVISDGHAPVMFVSGVTDLIEDVHDRFGLVRREGETFAPGHEQAAVTELWALGTDPGVVSDDPTVALQQFVVDIPAGATKWLITQMGPGAGAPMHATPSIDYGLVVMGDVELGLDTGPVHLYPGDAVVVNAVQHSWRAGLNGCVIATVMVGLRDADR